MWDRAKWHHTCFPEIPDMHLMPQCPQYCGCIVLPGVVMAVATVLLSWRYYSINTLTLRQRDSSHCHIPPPLYPSAHPLPHTSVLHPSQSIPPSLSLNTSVSIPSCCPLVLPPILSRLSGFIFTPAPVSHSISPHPLPFHPPHLPPPSSPTLRVCCLSPSHSLTHSLHINWCVSAAA